MNYENDIEKAKKELINLFLKITITNKEEVYKHFFILLLQLYRQNN